MPLNVQMAKGELEITRRDKIYAKHR